MAKITTSYLRRLLSKPPPKVEKVNDGEVWLLDDSGERKKRICGRWRSELPNIVPFDDDENPHGVVNPAREYVCTEEAGDSTLHPGIGACARHQQELVDPSSESRTPVEVQDSALMTAGQFGEFLDVARAKVAPDELLDITRPLYELEALKMMIVAYMQETGYNLEGVEAIAGKIKDAAQVQLMLAKRDHEIIKNKAIATIIQMLVVGFLEILNTSLKDDRGKAREIAQRLNNELLIPAQKSGLTEILQRQQASGAYDRAADYAAGIEDAQLVDMPPGVM